MSTQLVWIAKKVWPFNKVVITIIIKIRNIRLLLGPRVNGAFVALVGHPLTMFPCFIRRLFVVRYELIMVLITFPYEIKKYLHVKSMD